MTETSQTQNPPKPAELVELRTHKSKKHTMKSLKHNGVYVPKYDVHGFSVTIRGTPIKLGEKSEPMAVAWIRKRQSAASPPDRVFMKNFMQEFLKQIRQENPTLEILNAFSEDYLKKIESATDADVCNPIASVHQDIDFSEVSSYVEAEKAKKAIMTTEEKKQLAAERKVKREELKAKYAIAEVDGQTLEVANWTAEPSCLFAGRGDHPQRGKWKEGPSKSDITLNTSGMTDEEAKKDGWAGAVWEPQKMYVAKWEDKLAGKIKYVWFSDTAFLKQNREKAKFQKAELLGKQIVKIQDHIMRNLTSKDETRRKVATVCWLILNPNMRVGDEKDPDEADTVGAITLRDEHVTTNKEAGMVHFDFLGKDSVRWVKDVEAPLQVIDNLEYFKAQKSDYLFVGVDSKMVSRFLSEKMPGLTAKVFRTWRCTKTVKEELDKSGVTKADPDYLKAYAAKEANLRVAEVANHKRKVPPTFDDRLAKKEERIKELNAQLAAKQAEGKKTDSLQVRIKKAELDLQLSREAKEYNLGTSLKSYIDPTAYVKWAKKVKFDITKFYPKTLQKKFSWALQGKSPEPECIPA